MSAPKHTALGPGLSVADGSGYSSPQRPGASPQPDGTWRAEISGVENGAVVRSWNGPAFARKPDAVAAARLIAAAPEMAGVIKPGILRRAARTVERDHPGVAAILDAVADEQAHVLAKATGEVAS